MKYPGIIAALSGGGATVQATPPISLVQPGVVDPRLVWVRDQPNGTKSTALGADGATWDEYNLNTPRFHGVGRNVLVEGGSRTNWINNPRAEEAKPGLVNSTPLVAPGYLASAFTTTRAHTPTTALATRQLADGTWATVAQNLPRFTGPSQRLLVEGARTNLIRNPRMEGWTAGVVGSGGVLPTNMSVSGGLAAEVFGIVTVNGMPMLDVGLSTTGVVSGSLFQFEAASGCPLAASTAYTASAFVAAVGGSFTNISVCSLRVRVDAATAANAGGVALLSAVATPARFVAPAYTTAADATAGRLQIVVNTSAAASVRLLLGWPQLEAGDFASTPILPPVGAPAAATRDADVITATMAALGLPATGACTMAMKLLRTVTTIGASQQYVNISDGSQVNRIQCRGSGTSTNNSLARVTANVGGNTGSMGAAAAGVLFNCGMKVDGVGNAVGYHTTLVTQTGCAVTGLTTFHIGHTRNVSGPVEFMWGEIESLVVTPQVLDDTRFQSFVNAGYSSDGQIPPYWMMGDGISEVLGTGIENGINYIDLRLEGEAGTSFLEFGWSYITPGDPWSASQFVKLLSGSLTGVTLQTHIPFEDSGATTLLDSTVDFVPGAGALGSQRYLNQNAVAPATSELVRHRIQWVATGSYSFVLRVGWPQLEEGLYISSPVLPAVGTPATAVRGTEYASATLASLGILSNGASYTRFTHRVGILPAVGVATQTMFQIDDGTANNRATKRMSAETLLSRGINYVGGVGTNALTNQPPNTAGFATFEMNVRGDGTVEYVTNNDTGTNYKSVTAAGAPLSGMTTFRIARPAEGGSPFWGEVQEISIAPHVNALVTLVAPGVLNPVFTTTRTQTPAGTMATRQLADGTWAEMAAGTARFHGTAQRLLVEGARTNSIRNPRCEGTVGAIPTNWTVGLRGGLAVAYGAAVTVNGLRCIPLTITGAPADTTASLIFFEQFPATPAADTEVWTGSFFVGLDPSYANNTGAIVNFECRVLPQGSAESLGTLSPPSTTFQRMVHTKTMIAGTTAATLGFRFASATAGVPMDFRVLVAAPQLEKGDFASTPILPAVGVPAAATRGADLISAPLASLGLAASGASTTVAKSLRTVFVTGAPQEIVDVDDGTSTNRMMFRSISASANYQAGRALAGAGGISVAIVGPAVGVLFNSGFRVDGAGNVSGYIAGSSLQTIAGGPTSGMLTYRIGNYSAGTAPFWGEIERLSLTPTVLDDAQFQFLVNAIP